MVLRSKLTAALSFSVLLLGILLYLGFGSFGDPRPRDVPLDVPSGAPEVVEPGGESPPVTTDPATTPTAPTTTATTTAPPRVVTYRPLLTQGGWTLRGRIVTVQEEALGSDLSEWQDAEPAKGVTVRLKPHPRHPDDHPIATHERKTPDDGLFEFRGVPGDVWLRLEIDEPSSAFRTLSFRLGKAREEGVKELGDIPLDPAQRLTFLLLDPTGEPIRKGSVLVNATSDNPRRSRRLRRLGIDDSRRRAVELRKADAQEGVYVLERAVSGAMYVTASAPGHSPSGRIEFESPLDDGALEIELEAGHTIAGQVTTLDGQPIVRAELAGGLASTAERTRSDERGEFLFEGLAPGEHTVLVRAAGYVDDRREDVQTGTDDLLFELRPEAVVTGRIIALATQQPLAQARVALREAASELAYSAYTGADGKFTIDGIAAGRFALTVDHGDYASLTLETPLELHEGAQHAAGDLALEIGLRIHGVVANSETQSPVPDATVRFFQSSREDEAAARSVTTDEEGAFEVVALSPGEYVIEVVARNHIPAEPREVVFTDESHPPLELWLDPGQIIEGVVVDAQNGEPISDVRVTVAPTEADLSPGQQRRDPPTATSDEDGAFELTGLSAGAVTISVTHSSYPSLRLQESAGGEPLRIELGGGGGIRGLVQRGGSPLEGVDLRFSQIGGGASANTETGPDGRYEVRGLRAGQYRVSLRFRQRRRSLRTTVYRDQVTELNVDEPAGVRVTGQITVGGDRVTSGTMFAIDPQQGGQSDRASISAAGEYELELPGPGRYSLLLQLSGRGNDSTRVPLVVPPGQAAFRRDIEISGGVIEGRVIDAESGEGIGGVQVIVIVPQGGPESFVTLINSLSSLARTKANGRFEIHNVETGTYSLRAFATSYADVRLDGVRAGGGRTDVGDLELIRGVSFAFGVVDEQGRPIPDATVLVRDLGGSIVGLQEPIVSQPDGTATVNSVAPGSYSASFRHPSYAPIVRDVVVSDEPGALEIVLRPGGMLKVAVTETDGAPLVGIAVHVVDGTGWDVLADRIDFRGRASGTNVTDAKGQLDAGHLTPGDYQVFAATPDGRRSQLAQVSIARGATEEIVIHMEE